MSQINLKKNIALSSISKILTIIAAFVTNWFLARYLGPELRGKYVYLFTLNSIIWMFLDLGVHQSFPYLLQNKKTHLNNLYNVTVLTFIVGLGLVFGLYFLAGDFFYNLLHQDYPRYILLVLGIYIVSFQFYMRTQFLQLGMDYVKEYSIMAFLPVFCFMLLIIPLYSLMPPGQIVEYSFMLNVAVFVFFLFVLQWRFRHAFSLKTPLNKHIIGQSYKLGLRAFVSEYLVLLLMRMDLIILKALGSYAQVGVYTLAVNFVDIINMSCNTIGAVLLVKLSSLNDELAALSIMRRIFLIVSIINIVAILGMAIFGRWFIGTLYGVEYLDAYTAFLLLTPAIFGITFGALFNTFIWSKGFPSISMLAPIAPLLLKLALNYLLVPQYGLFGTSIASSICYVLWFIIMLSWYFIKHPDMKLMLLCPKGEDFKEMANYSAIGLNWLKHRIGFRIS